MHVIVTFSFDSRLCPLWSTLELPVSSLSALDASSIWARLSLKNLTASHSALAIITGLEQGYAAIGLVATQRYRMLSTAGDKTLTSLKKPDEFMSWARATHRYAVRTKIEVLLAIDLSIASKI